MGALNASVFLFLTFGFTYTSVNATSESLGGGAAALAFFSVVITLLSIKDCISGIVAPRLTILKELKSLITEEGN